MLPRSDEHEFLEPERRELREPLAYSFSFDRREFFGIAGAGLLISVLAPAASAQRTSAAPPTLEARIHIGEDGTVTVLTGKVEEGQGPRTELAMAAAEELHLPLSSVRVVMADTGLVPNDGLTAGSRTTPSTLPAVRLAAAAAWGLLETARASRGGQKFTYADLAKSPELASANKKELSKDTVLTAVKDWKILGTRQTRVNGVDIVTGAHQYPSDIRRPGMLYGCVLRPPSYGATLESVDLLAAQNLKRVIAVRDAEFAGCAAPTSYEARKALDAIAASARWRPKDHPSGDELYAWLKKHSRARTGAPEAVTEALQKAAKKVEAAYQVAYIQHAPMEPRAAVAEWQDGKLTVWTGTSNPFSVRDQLAQAFHVPAASVRVIVPDMGGGFGGKHTGEVALEAARLAKEARRPVSLRWTRAEEFMWAYFRPAGLIEVAGGLDENGKVVAWDFVNYNSGTAALACHYEIPNSFPRFVPSEGPLREGSYRCLAATANNFARECFMDELGAAAGADPLEFRLAHLTNTRLRDVLSAAAAKFGWSERRKAKRPNVGIGLACGTEKNSVVAACVEVEVDRATGTPRLLEICEAFECGPILNPLGLRSQVEGCIVMGLGAALREEILFENGRLKNGRFSQYRVPRFKDLPKMDLVLLDRKDLEPAGAGETPIIAVAPAIANAVFHATGIRARSMPVRIKPA